MSFKGKLIVIEGMEGSGKTTVINKLKDYCSKQNPNGYVFTREPGGTPFGESLREHIVNKDLDPVTKFFLFEAARREHFVKVIYPALKEGKIVIMDRFTDSTIAYQAFLEKVGTQNVINCNTLATSYNNLRLLDGYSLEPDLTIFLDVEFKTAQKRIRKRENNNMLDRMNMDEWNLVHKGYEFSFNQPDRTGEVIKIDTTNEEEGDVFIKVAKAIAKFKKQHAKDNIEDDDNLLEMFETTQLRIKDDWSND